MEYKILITENDIKNIVKKTLSKFLLKEYGSEQRLPFDDDQFKNKNYFEQYFDWLEDFGKYGKLSPSNDDFWEEIKRAVEYIIENNIGKDKGLEIFEADIDDIVDTIDNVMTDRYSKDDKEKKLCENVLKKLNVDTKNYELTFTIDHQFVYDAIANLDIDVGYDFEESLKVTKLFPYTLEDYIKDFEFQKKYDTFGDASGYDFYSVFNKIINKYVDLHPNSRNKILNVNPNFREGIYKITEYYDSYVLMQLYKKKYTKVLLDDLGDEYVKFLNFFYKMKALDWNLVIHNYTGQDGDLYIKRLKDYYQNIVNFIISKDSL